MIDERCAKIPTGFIILVFFIGTSISAIGQNPAPSPVSKEGEDVIRVDTSLVTIPVTVSNSGGMSIPNLQKDVFQIFEDDVEQEIAYFAPVEEPFTILFLLNTGEAMTPHMPDLARAANAFLGQLRPNDQMIAVSFCDSSTVLQDAARVGAVRGQTKIRLRVCSGKRSFVYDAVDYGIKRLKTVRGRRAIVLFSDGVGDGVKSSANQNLRDLREEDILVYPVQYRTVAVPTRYAHEKNYLKRLEGDNGYMRDLAGRTGGRHYQVENIPDLAKAFALVAEELGRQYSLGYYPTEGALGQKRQIKVKVRLPNVVVRVPGRLHGTPYRITSAVESAVLPSRLPAALFLYPLDKVNFTTIQFVLKK